MWNLWHLPFHNSELFLAFLIYVSDGKKSTCNAREFDPWVGKIPWRKAWQPTPVYLLGESHGQRSLVGYSPEGSKESVTTE